MLKTEVPNFFLHINNYEPTWHCLTEEFNLERSSASTDFNV